MGINPNGKIAELRRDILAWEPRVERGGLSWREVKRRAGVVEKKPRRGNAANVGPGSHRPRGTMGHGGSHTQMVRLVENYVRHEMTDYDTFLEQMVLKHGDVAVRETYWFALDRVTPKILEAFPELQFRNPRNEK
jgi:hypothetical protein